jgi:hypothetical protein
VIGGGKKFWKLNKALVWEELAGIAKPLLHYVSPRLLLLQTTPPVGLQFASLHVLPYYRGSFIAFMAQHNYHILNWNVRGLNDGARQDSVNELVRSTGATIVCLQETKMQLLDQNVVTRTVGAKFANSFAVLPAKQTQGASSLR